MLPDFLKYLRVNGYRVVHVVPKPKGPDKHANSSPKTR
jgi:hypothetical protein